MEQTIEAMDTYNVVQGVLGGSPQRVKQWIDEAPGRFIPGINFNIDSPNAIEPDSLRKLFDNGSVEVFAEITNQYTGTTPDDERMQPYWALAEEMDIPVGIHIGPGPPGVLYLSGSGYRARLHSPLILEDILASHPRLRIYIMHAGYPMLDDLLAVLYTHPQVYVGIGVIVYTQPEAAFYRFLKGIVEAGFGKRIMFGSDQMNWPGVIGPSIDRIREAPFLTEEQKRDILYNNAARFLRLSEEEIRQHHD
nr:amidohydrolase family protein [Rhodohalobacter mucosus]